MIEFVQMLDGSESTPLYLQLYQKIRQAIQFGTLNSQEKLPGKRSLAEQLGISVNTVDTAYQLLVAEGYLESKPRSGFYVAQVEHINPITTYNTLSKEPIPTQWKFNLSTNGIDSSLFPFKIWGRIQKELLYSNPQLLVAGMGQGDFELRQALAQHLQQYRGVVCSPHQIIVGAGIEYLFGLLVPLLGQSIGIENPGYPQVKQVIHNGGSKSIAVLVDKKGLSVEELQKTTAQSVYVTPSHQFPTGVTMPVGRRTELLNWAYQQPNRMIIEDDYDSEFRFQLRPLPSLQGMDKGNRVVYISTFSKSLAPSIRIACMVLPDSLREKWNQRYNGYACTVSRFEQQTLARFIQEGYFSRHLSRLRNQYRKRMELFYHELKARWGNRIKITAQHTGLHFLVEVVNKNEKELVKAAKSQGIYLTELEQYNLFSPKKERNAILIGYGSLTESQIPLAAQALQQAWKGLL